jgi:DHA1 family tetracycline resistance protein-like MFS transporter
MMARRPLLPIFLIVLVDVLGLTIILPLLPLYAEKFDASPRVIGVLYASYALCALISGPILGQISDRVGRKPLLAISQLGTLVGFILLAEARTLWVLFAARIIDGLTAGNLSLAQAYISDVTEPKDRAKSFALIGIAFGIGFFIGPAISGLLAKNDMRNPIYLAAALSALSVIATLTLLPRATQKEGDGPAGRRLTLLSWSRYVEYFRRPGLGALLFQFFAFAFAFATFTSGFALFAERRLTWHGHPFGTREVGFLFAYAGFLGIILQGGLIGRLVKRFGEPQLTRVAFGASCVGYGALGFIATVPGLVAAATVQTFGHGTVRPTLTSAISQHAARDEQGVVLGLTQSLMSVAQILAPLLGGFLIDNGALVAWALVASAASAIGLGLAMVTPRG